MVTVKRGAKLMRPPPYWNDECGMMNAESFRPPRFDGLDACDQDSHQLVGFLYQIGESLCLDDAGVGQKLQPIRLSSSSCNDKSENGNRTRTTKPGLSATTRRLPQAAANLRQELPRSKAPPQMSLAPAQLSEPASLERDLPAASGECSPLRQPRLRSSLTYSPF